LIDLDFSAEGEDSKEEIELNPRTLSVSSTQGVEQPGSDQVDFARGPDNIKVDTAYIVHVKLM
jgi:hypothetical protein